jgi:DNA-binding transcriptional LysR family regulator
LESSMNLTSRQLEVFLCAASLGSFAEAAACLGISQSAVSNHVAALEAELGRKLFVRRRGASPNLSLDGIQFLPEVRRFLDVAKDLSKRDPAAEKLSLRVYAGSHILESLLKPLLTGFHEINPDILLTFTTESTFRDVEENLRARRIHCAIFASPNSKTGQDTEVIGELQSGLYVRNDASLEQNAFRAEGLILPPEDSIEAAILAEQIIATGFRQIPVRCRTQYPAVSIDMAKKGPGIVPLLETMVRHHDSSRTLRMIRALPPWYLCTAISMRLPETARSAIRTLFQDAAKHVASAQESATGRV